MQKVIPISESVVNYIQSLDYEISGLKVLHTHALAASVSEDKVQEIKNAFLSKVQEFELAKQEIFSQVGGGVGQRFWIDYMKGAVILVE